MRCYGLDFTSAPTAAKPITLAVGWFAEGLLRIENVLRVTTFKRFERCLAEPEEWIAGMDFPFGQPQQLIEDLSWPDSWSECLDQVAAMTRREWEDLLLLYKAARPKGQKELFRATDRVAGSQSPMKLVRAPVARMFYEGATRLRRTTLSVQPCRPTSERRIVIEAYPALPARRLIGHRSYKEDGKRSQTRHDARRDLVAALTSERLAQLYGLRVEVGPFLAEEMVEDPSADQVDAALSAVQAAWAQSRREANFGMPPDCDPREGWIADPAGGLP